jgi:hypothetical protein
MSRIASIFAWLATSLWLGGMIFLFIAVQTLFRAFPKATSDVALRGAPALFAAFERYQLVLAATSLVAAFVWYLASRSKWIIAVFLLLSLSAAGAALSTTLITPEMERLRLAGQSASPRFAQLHGRSMLLYVSQAGALLVTALLLPAATRAAGSPLRRERAPSGVATSQP